MQTTDASTANWWASSNARIEKYRAEVRATFQRMSGEALAFQDARISRNPCVDRQEINRELDRRATGGQRVVA